MKKKFKKGIITIQTVFTVGSFLCVGCSIYFGNVITTNNAINESEKELIQEISVNKNEIIVNTTNIININEKLDDISGKLDTLILKL